MTRRRTAIAAAFLALVASTPWAGHAGAATKTTTLDRDAARRTVEQVVHTSYPTLTFGNIACPSGIVRRSDVQFTCTIQLPGTFLVLGGRQTDSRGTVTFTSDQVLLARDALTQFVAQNSSIDAVVDCGGAPWRAVRVGTTIGCNVALADGTGRHVDLSVRDREGTVAIVGVT